MRLDAIRVKIKMRVTGRGLDFDHRVVKRKGKKKLEDVKCGRVRGRRFSFEM